MGWSLAYVGLAGASWVLVPLSQDPRQNIDAAWNSAKALGASLLVLVEPLQVMRDQRRMEALMAEPDQPEQRLKCAQPPREPGAQPWSRDGARLWAQPAGVGGDGRGNRDYDK